LDRFQQDGKEQTEERIFQLQFLKKINKLIKIKPSANSDFLSFFKSERNVIKYIRKPWPIAERYVFEFNLQKIDKVK
jgi:hypothetical protein